MLPFFRCAQMLPWLRNNVIVQWLLLGSFLLQTISEVAAINAASKRAAGLGNGSKGLAGGSAGN